MIIKVNVQELKKKRHSVSSAEFFLKNEPDNLRELIYECVCTCVDEYNQCVDNGNSIKILSDEEISDKTTVGKIAFGINYGGKKADVQTALETAFIAFDDGLFRVFISGKPVLELDDKISLKPNDEVTFIRLTMLSGHLW